MVLGFLLDTTLRSGTWAVSKTYDGVSYLIYGPRKDPVLSKLEDLENKLNLLNNQEETLDQEFYWLSKHQYQNHHWVAISQQKLICQSSQKTEVLRAMADLSAEDPTQKCLLVQVGNEINMFTI